MGSDETFIWHISVADFGASQQQKSLICPYYFLACQLRRHFACANNALQSLISIDYCCHAVLYFEVCGYRLHELKGKLKGHWAIDASGNWRIVFKFVDGDAHVVNYEDYH